MFWGAFSASEESVHLIERKKYSVRGLLFIVLEPDSTCLLLQKLADEVIFARTTFVDPLHFLLLLQSDAVFFVSPVVGLALPPIRKVNTTAPEICLGCSPNAFSDVIAGTDEEVLFGTDIHP